MIVTFKNGRFLCEIEGQLAEADLRNLDLSSAALGGNILVRANLTDAILNFANFMRFAFAV